MRARRDLNPRPSALLISDRGPTLLSVLSYGPGQGARRTIVQIALRKEGTLPINGRELLLRLFAEIHVDEG